MSKSLTPLTWLLRLLAMACIVVVGLVVGLLAIDHLVTPEPGNALISPAGPARDLLSGDRSRQSRATLAYLQPEVRKLADADRVAIVSVAIAGNLESHSFERLQHVFEKFAGLDTKLVEELCIRLADESVDEEERRVWLRNAVDLLMGVPGRYQTVAQGLGRVEEADVSSARAQLLKVADFSK